MLIPTQTKYATLALQTHMCGITEAFEVAPGVFVSREAPYTVPEHWTAWLGSFAIEDLAEADVHITAFGRSETLDELNLENRRLASKVQHLYAGLLISTPGLQMTYGRMLSGAHRADRGIDVRQSQQQNNVYRVLGTNAATVLTAGHFARAHRLGECLREQRRREGRDGIGDFGRLNRCIRAMYSCVESRNLEHRLHQAVRVVEGLLGSGKEEFGDHHLPRIVEYVLADCPDLHELPRTLYTLRSKVEHLYGAGAAVVAAKLAKKDEERSAYVRFAQATHAAEFLAQSILSYVVEEETLWPHFSHDKGIRDFWRKHASRLWSLQVGKALFKFQRTFDTREAERAFDDHQEDQAFESQVHLESVEG
jgi:hypothetical protein